MKVALVKGDNRRDNITGALHHIWDEMNARKPRAILIKPNLTAIKGDYSNTSREAVSIIIDFLNDHWHPEQIFIGDGSAGAHCAGISTWQVFKNMNYEDLTDIENVKLMNIDELPHDSVLYVDTCEGKEAIHIARPEVDLIISLAIPKTHDLAIATMGMKNMMGLILPEDREKIHGYCNIGGKDSKRLFKDNEFYLQCVRIIHKNLFDLCRLIQPDLTVIDGLIGMEGDGPIEGDPLHHGFALASFDPLAADTVCSRIMGLQTADIGYLHYLTESLGHYWRFEIIGENPEQVKKNYRLHRMYHLQKLWRIS